MVTDLAEVFRLGTAKAEENLAFRRYLSAKHRGDQPFRILATRVQQQMDCTNCANCCRRSIVPVSKQEIEDIARQLRATPEEVTRLYTVPDPEATGSRILMSSRQGVSSWTAISVGSTKPGRRPAATSPTSRSAPTRSAAARRHWPAGPRFARSSSMRSKLTNTSPATTRGGSHGCPEYAGPQHGHGPSAQWIASAPGEEFGKSDRGTGRGAFFEKR